MNEVLRLDGCSKSYRRGAEIVHALRDVSLVLESGELVALVGPSGSGKTTLIHVIVGWETPDAGHVRWSDDSRVDAVRPWSDLGVVPQRLGLLEELTVAENVALPLRLQSAATDAVDDLLESLDLAALADRFPGEVSLGEQQRTAIARALVLQPPLVVLDEPTAHQDEDHAKVVLAALQLARDAGTCCLLATHADDVVAVVDRVVTMTDGRVLHPRHRRPSQPK